MTDTGITQDNSTLSAPPIGALTSQDWFDRMKLVHNRAIPISLLSVNNIFADVFKISIGYTKFDTRKIQSRLLPFHHPVVEHRLEKKPYFTSCR